MADEINKNFLGCFGVGYGVRTMRLGGLQGWQLSKKQYSTYQQEFPVGKIKSLIDQFFVPSEDKDQSSCVVRTDKFSIQNGADLPHFFVQLFRIAYMCGEIIPYVKLMQIAYNIGQFEAACEEDETYDAEVIRFYNDNNLGDINTYI